MTNEGNRFKDVVVLVTGVARPARHRRTTALRLAAEGANVACLDIAAQYEEAPAHATATADDLDSVVAEIEALGRKAIAVARTCRTRRVEAAVATTTDTLGTITAVANVAGGSGVGFGLGPLLAVLPAEFRHVLDVNLVGTWLVTKACATRMIAAGTGGLVCNVSSQAGKKGFAMLGAYCAAKAGVILLTQTLALELGPQGISVNAVCPGTVDTDLVNPAACSKRCSAARAGSTRTRTRDPAATVAECGGDRRGDLLAAVE